MAAQISRIIPLLVITLLCIAAVEGGYRMFEYLLFREPAEETVSSGPPGREEVRAAAARRDPGIILTRNLFGQDFQGEDTPKAAPVDAAANLNKSELEVVLVGTIGGSEGMDRAIILDKKSRKQDLYKEGDEIKGASVKEIQRGRVILEVEGREELLDMSEAAAVRPAVRPAPQGSMGQAQQGLPPPEPVPPAAGMEPQGGPVTVEVGSADTESAAEEAAAPTEEAAPQAETASEAALEAAPPEEAGPQSPPEAAPPAGNQAAPERKIVRPRIIRPYRQ